jgi:hypothetical protein
VKLWEDAPINNANGANDMTKAQFKKCQAIWNGDAELRAEWKDDFDAYIDSMVDYYQMCNDMGQVS